MEVILDEKFVMIRPTKVKSIGLKTYETIYEFALGFHQVKSAWLESKNRVGGRDKKDL